MNNEINLGDKVRDTITGFEGIAIGRTKWLFGCDRITVQPDKTGKEGKILETHSFDAPQLVLVRRAKVKVVKQPKEKTGGFDYKVTQKEAPMSH